MPAKRGLAAAAVRSVMRAVLSATSHSLTVTVLPPKRAKGGNARKAEEEGGSWGTRVSLGVFFFSWLRWSTCACRGPPRGGASYMQTSKRSRITPPGLPRASYYCHRLACARVLQLDKPLQHPHPQAQPGHPRDDSSEARPRARGRHAHGRGGAVSWAGRDAHPGVGRAGPPQLHRRVKHFASGGQFDFGWLPARAMRHTPRGPQHVQ